MPALPSRARLALGAAAVAVLAATVWLLTGRDPESQARATFARLEQAVEARDASAVVAELHAEYPFTALWPGWFDQGESLGATGGEPRAIARRGMAVLFLQRQEGLRMDHEVRRLSARDDGTVEAEVVIDVSSTGGGGQVVSPREVHRFTLAPEGWLKPTWRIRGHERFTVSP